MSRSKILLIEDHSVTRKNIARFLQDEGFEVRDTGDGREALNLLTPAPDLIITDFVLPGISGRELLQCLRSRADLTPVIVISATVTEEMLYDIRDCQIADHLVKPFNLDELLARIHLAMERT